MEQLFLGRYLQSNALSCRYEYYINTDKSIIVWIVSCLAFSTLNNIASKGLIIKVACNKRIIHIIIIHINEFKLLCFSSLELHFRAVVVLRSSCNDRSFYLSVFKHHFKCWKCRVLFCCPVAAVSQKHHLQSRPASLETLGLFLFV